MLHMVCNCGALISLAPPPGPRTARCRSCGAVVAIPDPASLGIAPEEPPVPVRLPTALEGREGEGPETGSPGGGATSAGAVEPAAAASGGLPSFDRDDRLDLRDLERQAGALGVLARVAALGGILAAGGVAAATGLSPALRIALGCAALLAGLVGWAAARGARRAAIASIALAERQRELMRGLARR